MMDARRCLSILAAWLVFLAAFPLTGQAAPPLSPPDPLHALQESTGSGLRVARDPATGRVTFLGADPAHPMPQPRALPAGTTPEDAARAFLAQYGPLFGLTDAAGELRAEHSKPAEAGRSVVRFQQVSGRIPVFGGELIVQVDRAMNVISANGRVGPVPAKAAQPAIDAERARNSALRKVADEQGVTEDVLAATPPELWLYNPAFVGHPGPDRASLAWRTEVRARGDGLIRELVLVDAIKGHVVLNFNQVDTALNRRIYDNQNNPIWALPLPGPNLVRSEGEPPTGNADADHAYDYAGQVYNYYLNTHERHGIDGADMALVSTVNYCPNALNCPYQNAAWTGEQMIYGQGFAAALDVVGHEMTHGVTQYESRLFYYYQSGAINESLSDIWGELIEHTANASTDPEWLMGEDLSIGAVRSMSNPTAYGDPDRMTSSYYTADANRLDNGGVHTNSGVGNKAAYLIIKGGTFNGKTVAALGLTKAAKIYYKSQTDLLVSGSDYQDLYQALQQACTTLVGTSGITASDCQQVRNALDAVEMNGQPGAAPAPEAPTCAPGQQPVNILFDNLENPGSGRWTKGATTGAGAWYYPQNPNPYAGFDATYTTSGVYNFWGDDPATRSDSYIGLASPVSLPAGKTAYLRFNHAYGFDFDTGGAFDGGVIEYSVNGGPWLDGGSLITDNGYGGTISSARDNPLAGRAAFVRESHGYISTRLNLASLAGQQVRFRFRIGSDSRVGDWGWFVDDVRLYTCGAQAGTVRLYLPWLAVHYPAIPAAPVLAPIGNAGGCSGYTLAWSAASLASSYTLQEDDNGSFAHPTTMYTGPGTSWTATNKAAGTYYYRVRASNGQWNSNWSNSQSTVVGTGPCAGYWSSDTGDEFNVTSDQRNVQQFAIYITVSACGNYRIYNPNLVPISNNRFAFSGSFHASGTFSSRTVASGSDGLSNFYIPGCGAVSGGPWSYVATWRHAISPAFRTAHLVTAGMGRPAADDSGYQVTRLP